MAGRVADVVERLQSILADRYRIERELGAGGMATVYLAEDLRHHRKVALKLLHPEIAVTVGAGRFAREIEVAARLQHPNILPLLDSGEGDGLFFYVMPYVEGESLRDRLGREGQLPIPIVVRILMEVADALSHAHARGVVHRDIKPDNVLLSGRHALVADFGVAKAVTAATGYHPLTSVGIALGTPTYMAPEQATADSNQDHRVDIYALGVLGYELLTGQAPFAATTAQEMLAAQVIAEPKPLRECRPAVPPGLAEVVMRCLAKDPADRWQTAEEVLARLEPLATPSAGGLTAVVAAAVARRVGSLRRAVSPRRAAAGAAAVLLLAVALVAIGRYARIHWARTVAIPAIQRLVNEAEWGRAHALAKRARVVLPHDSALAALWRAASGTATIRSVPPGARVYRRDNAAPDTAWEYVGTTPLEGLLLPLAPAYSRLMLVKSGFDTVEDLVAPSAAAYRYQLDRSGSLPPGMVRVAGATEGLRLWGLDNLAPMPLQEFLLGRYEVTNREFKRFVDAGGYANRDYWQFPFLEGGRELTWEQAVSRFRDQSGRPGPAIWEAGTYPAGEDDHPVTGVSWYEAAAYARFAGADLPTIFHWARAARIRYSAGIVPLGNLESRHKSTLVVGRSGAMSGFGALDMAGNAREWALNESGTRERYILGGGWDDGAFAFTSAQSTPPFDRSPMNGLRIARYLSPDTTLAAASRPVPLPSRDFRTIPPVNDAVFAAYRRLYAYDRTPLHAAVEATDSSSRDWVRQRITFDAAYGHERVIAYLFLPRHGTPPYQTVVYFPGDQGLAVRSSRELLGMEQVDYVMPSGRALIYPVFKSTYERGDGLLSSMPQENHSYTEHVVEWAKDLGRSIDYLETRADIDTARLAYFGYSWGGRLGGIMLAVEPRLKVAVLNVAGLRPQKAFPEAEPVYFLPRIRVPVLMLNGRYDFYFPVESSQNPMFELLGTRPSLKRHVIAEGSHYLPRPLLIRETLDWLDRYLGPVR